MMKYADSLHAQHGSKQLCCAGQRPALNIGHPHGLLITTSEVGFSYLV